MTSFRNVEIDCFHSIGHLHCIGITLAHSHSVTQLCSFVLKLVRDREVRIVFNYSYLVEKEHNISMGLPGVILIDFRRRATQTKHFSIHPQTRPGPGRLDVAHTKPY